MECDLYKTYMQIRKNGKEENASENYHKRIMPNVIGKLHSLSDFFFASYIFIIFCCLEVCNQSAFLFFSSYCYWYLLLKFPQNGTAKSDHSNFLNSFNSLLVAF